MSLIFCNALKAALCVYKMADGRYSTWKESTWNKCLKQDLILLIYYGSCSGNNTQGTNNLNFSFRQFNLVRKLNYRTCITYQRFTVHCQLFPWQNLASYQLANCACISATTLATWTSYGYLSMVILYIVIEVSTFFKNYTYILSA